MRHLSNRPQKTEFPGIWFYEEPARITFVIEPRSLDGTVQVKLSRRWIEGYVKRARADRKIKDGKRRPR